LIPRSAPTPRPVSTVERGSDPAHRSRTHAHRKARASPQPSAPPPPDRPDCRISSLSHGCLLGHSPASADPNVRSRSTESGLAPRGCVIFRWRAVSLGRRLEIPNMSLIAGTGQLALLCAGATSRLSGSTASNWRRARSASKRARLHPKLERSDMTAVIGIGLGQRFGGGGQAGRLEAAGFQATIISVPKWHSRPLSPRCARHNGPGGNFSCGPSKSVLAWSSGGGEQRRGYGRSPPRPGWPCRSGRRCRTGFGGPSRDTDA
jgi:hypothetical protein